MDSDLARLLRETPPDRITPEAVAIMAKIEGLLNEAKREDARFEAALVQGLFPEQLAALADESRQQALLCPRRSGKTHLLVSKIFKAARKHPQAQAAVFIDIDKKKARDLVWQPLKDRLDDMGIKYRANETRLEIRVKGWCPIWLRGADDKAEIEKYRGFKFAIVVLDECASYGPYFDKMIDESIGPALEDYAAQLVLAGTPGAARVGKFWKVTRPNDPLPGWSVRRWTILENVRFPRWFDNRGAGTGLDPAYREIQQEMLRAVRARNGWTEQTPAYRREWLGEWVQDDQGLVYHWLAERNGYDGHKPEGHQWEHVLGVDLGHDDAFATVVMAYSPRLPDLWVVDRFKQPGLDVTDCAEHIQRLVDAYHPHSTMIDTGGLGKQIAEELRRRHHISCEPAVKTEKAATIKVMNADFNRGLIHELQDSELASEWSVLQWAAGKVGLVEDPNFQNHLCDAALYAWRKAYAYTYRPQKVPPKPGSPEAAQEEADAMERAAMGEASRRNRW